MALLPVHHWVVGSGLRLSRLSAELTQVVDATNVGVACKFLGNGKTITHVGADITALSGTPTLRWALEGVGSTGDPNNTVKGGGSPASFSGVPGGTGWVWRELTNTHATTLGEKLAATVRYSSGATSATIRYGMSTHSSGMTLPVGMNNVAGVWGDTTILPAVSVKFSDGSALHGSAPVESHASAVWNSGSTPRYRGIKFVPQFDVRVAGFFWIVRPDEAATDSDFNVEVYEGASGTPIAGGTVAVTIQDMIVDDTNNFEIFVPFNLVLTKDSIYRFVVNPQTTQSQINAARLGFPDAAGKNALFGDVDSTTASTPGSWTDSSINDFYSMGLIVDQIDPISKGVFEQIPSIIRKVKRSIFRF